MFPFSSLQDDKPIIVFMHHDVLLCLNEFSNSIQGKKGQVMMVTIYVHYL